MDTDKLLAALAANAERALSGVRGKGDDDGDKPGN
jgi:hypothetical protein